MSLIKIIDAIKNKGLNYSSYFGIMNDDDTWSYIESYNVLKECYNRYISHPYNFTVGGAYGKTYYEFDPQYYKGTNIEILYIILGLAKLCLELKITFNDDLRKILKNFFDVDVEKSISEVLPDDERNDFLNDYLMLKNKYEEA